MAAVKMRCCGLPRLIKCTVEAAPLGGSSGIILLGGQTVQGCDSVSVLKLFRGDLFGATLVCLPHRGPQELGKPGSFASTCI